MSEATPRRTNARIDPKPKFNGTFAFTISREKALAQLPIEMAKPPSEERDTAIAILQAAIENGEYKSIGILRPDGE